MSKLRYVLGIDLGTTNTVCAALTNAEKAQPFVCNIRQPFSSPGPDGLAEDQYIPSVFAVDETHGVLVGHYAKDEYARVRRDRSVSSVKRQMGTRWTKTIDGRVWHPEEVSGCILKAVRKGVKGIPNGKPLWVVITVPACFGTEQRRATLDAARLAGFDPHKTRLFDEPAAALLHQSCKHTAMWNEPKRLLILDVGGGTLDASYMLVRREGSTLHADLQGRSRYNELGGDDIDLTLAGLLLRRYVEETKTNLDAMSESEHRDLCSELLIQAEKAKVELCGQVQYGVQPDLRKPMKLQMRSAPGRKVYPLQVSLLDVFTAVAEFMPLPPKNGQSPDADRFHYSFNEAITQALESAERVNDGQPPGVDLVYLSGGSSRLPMLRDAVLIHPALYQRQVPVIPVDDPMNAVALGAARYAGTLAGFPGDGMVLEDRMFEGLYIRSDNSMPSEFIPPMTTITKHPKTVTRTFETGGPGTQVDIDLFTGSSEDDPDLQPIRKRSLTFTELLPPGHGIQLTATVTPNREISLKCTAELNGQQLTGTVKVLNEGPGGQAVTTGVLRDGIRPNSKPKREGDDELPQVNSAIAGEKS